MSLNLIVSPTGMGVRDDLGGSGYFGSRRGSRKHLGLDFSGKVGQEIIMPFTGIISRVSRPYHSDTTYSGALLIGERIHAKLWYFEPIVSLIEREIEQGKLIGFMQDITQKIGKHGSYGEQGVTPHVHLQIILIDPELLWEGL